jgi:hypothetical protein
MLRCPLTRTQSTVREPLMSAESGISSGVARHGYSETRVVQFMPTNGKAASGSLDDAYGEALPPNRIDLLEKALLPRSLQQLSSESAELLSQLMTATEQGLGVARYVYCELPILWVMDLAGNLWFSIEEIVNIDTHEFVLPRLRNAAVEEGKQRLGHPSLIGGNPGRIGGEIYFDNDFDPSSWFITNGSGRYGLCYGRTSLHLSNAAQCFAAHGIRLREFFIPTRGRTT